MIIANIVKCAKMYRFADAFSTLTRGGFLSREIEEKKLFDKLNPNNDPKIKNQIILFIADLIDQIIEQYINKSQSDLVQWFIDEFYKQHKHLQDIINYDNIEQNQVLNHIKKKKISNVRDLINENGSCITVLSSLTKFKNLNKQLPKQQQIKIKDINFTGLIQFVNSKEQNLNQIIVDGQPKTLQKINVPHVSSYKVYKCYPPQDPNKWRQCPQFVELNKKFAKQAKWCVIQGNNIAYGHYLDPKWNFYVLVTTSSNQPVMLFNFAENHNGQIKDIHDGSFSAYNEQLFQIIDWFAETYHFDTTKASDYKTYNKVKSIYQNNVQTDDLQLVYQTNNYLYYQENNTNSYQNIFYIMNKKGQCKFFIDNKKYNNQGTIIRPGNKDKFTDEIIDFLIQAHCIGVLNNLIAKKTIQKQNGNLYVKIVKYLLQNGGKQFVENYLFSGGIINQIMSFKDAVLKLNDSSKIVELLINNKVEQENKQWCLQFIINKNDINEYKQLLKKQTTKSLAFRQIENEIKSISGSSQLGVWIRPKFRCLIDLHEHIILSEYSSSKTTFNLYEHKLLQEQAMYFINQDIKYPLVLLQTLNEIKNNEQLMQKINNAIEDEQFYEDLTDDLHTAQLPIQLAQQIIDFNVQANNDEFIQDFLDNYNGQYGTYELDLTKLYNYVSSSQNANLIFSYLDNGSILYNDDNSWEICDDLVGILGNLQEWDLIFRLDWNNDTEIARAVANTYISHNKLDNAFSVIECVDYDEKYYSLDYYLSKAKENNNIQAIIDAFEKYADIIEQIETHTGNDLYNECLDFIVESNSNISDFWQNVKNNDIKNQIIDKIVEKNAVNSFQSIIDCYTEIQSVRQEEIIDMLIRNTAIKVIKQIPIQEISEYYIDDVITLFSQAQEYDYIMPLVKDEQYQFMADDIYEKGSATALFNLGTQITLDADKLNMSNDDIVINYFETQKGKDLLINLKKGFQQFTNNNNVSNNILLTVITNLFDDKQLNQEDLQKFILWAINSKLLNIDDSLFDLLLENHKYQFMLSTDNFQNKQKQVLEQLNNNEDKTALNIDELTADNITNAIDILSDQALIKFLSKKSLSENDQHYLINNRINVALNLVVEEKKKTFGSIRSQILIMQNCVEQNIDKELCKKYYETFSTFFLFGDLFENMNKIWQDKYTAQDLHAINSFRDYIKDNLKLSKKLINIANLLK